MTDKISSVAPEVEGEGEKQDWCDHCSGDLQQPVTRDGKRTSTHILCETCYRRFDADEHKRALEGVPENERHLYPSLAPSTSHAVPEPARLTLDFKLLNSKLGDAGFDEQEVRVIQILISQCRVAPIAAPAMDSDMLNWLQEQVEAGYVSMCFEVDGGVHVTLEPAGGESRSARNADTIRGAIARLMRQEEG